MPLLAIVSKSLPVFESSSGALSLIGLRTPYQVYHLILDCLKTPYQSVPSQPIL